MFQLLTGRLPFPTENLPQNRIEAARQLLELQRVDRDWCGELEGAVSPQAARVIGHCLAFDPQKRPESAAEVAQQFRRELATGPRVRRWIRSHRWSLSIATVFLLVIASIFGIGMSYRTPTHLRQYLAGLDYLDAGHFAQASECFAEAVETCEDFREALVMRRWTEYQLGLDYLDAGDYARARQCFETALESNKNFREALLMRGWTDLLAARQEELKEADRLELRRSAEGYFREAYRRHGCSESAASRAQCLAETGFYRDAGAYYIIARDRDFSTASVANNLGNCLSKTKQFELATEVLSEAIQLDPALSAAHWNLLDLRDRLGVLGILNQRDALENLQRALDQIKLMRDSVPQAADLELAAARIFAQALAIENSASNEGTEQRQRDLLKQVLESCETAIQLNLQPAKLEELQLTAPQLKKDVHFQKLLQNTAPAPPTPAEPIKALVDIFPEVRGRLAQTIPEN
jgi:Tfp pilus assembly protein PilF